jgi:GT2 family glycosyltransferase
MLHRRSRQRRLQVFSAHLEDGNNESAVVRRTNWQSEFSTNAPERISCRVQKTSRMSKEPAAPIFRLSQIPKTHNPLNYQHKFSISIVSHGHRDLVLALLGDIARLGRSDLDVILTWNSKTENTEIEQAAYPYRIKTIINGQPKGFASNHNAAFLHCNGEYFVILNPDIRLPEDPFDTLLEILHTDQDAICAPLILNATHEQEDSARYFPSPWILIKKAIAKILGNKPISKPIPRHGDLLVPDWIAGMFIVVPRHIYAALEGMSEDYFLYYEDVDFCARARLQGVKVLVSTKAVAIHEARRESHKSLKFFGWHLRSAIRFFASRAYRQTRLLNRS